jgi:hypothetical protein
MPQQPAPHLAPGAVGAVELTEPPPAHSAGCYPAHQQVRRPVIRENGRMGVNIIET